MKPAAQRRTIGTAITTRSVKLLCLGLALQCIAPPRVKAEEKSRSSLVQVRLSEWAVALSPDRIPPGPVVFEITNSGTIPHAFEIEGPTFEKSAPQIQPGAHTTLALELRAGSFEVYCPVGKDSHKMLGMMSHLTVGKAMPAPAGNRAGEGMGSGHERAEKHGGGEGEEEVSGPKVMKITGGGSVIQILPGPFPFADRAKAVIQNRPADQQADLNHKVLMGPYSNNVANISGDISLVASDRGAAGDSVDGVAEVTTQDGARWKIVMDRVQTRDIPYNPRFGGVIMGLFYHGSSGVHTPLVPTIQSSLALWAVAHLYRNDQLVTDDAMVHVMLLSRTRRTSDWALDCWDCSDRPIEELQLQVTAAPNTPPLEAPGGFLFVNWEKSTGQRSSM